MKLTNRQEFYSAGSILLIGLSTIFGSLKYSIGQLNNMGPGYYPLLLGVVLTLLGLILMASPIAEQAKRTRSPWQGSVRAWAAVVAGVAAFVVFGHYGGFIPATFLLVVITALGDPKNSLKAICVLGLCVTIASVLIFYYGMQMQFSLIQWG